VGARLARDVLDTIDPQALRLRPEALWIQNVAFWPINLMMHELAERKIVRGDREWRKHRTLDVPFEL
jgi:hypothetical protein